VSNRYHISPRTGLPNICRAKSANSCPIVGADGDHFDSKQEARDYTEKSLSKEHGIKSLSKKKPVVTKPLIPAQPVTRERHVVKLDNSDALALLNDEEEKREFLNSLPLDLDENEEQEFKSLAEEFSKIDFNEDKYPKKTFSRRYKVALALNNVDGMREAIKRYDSTVHFRLQRYPMLNRSQIAEHEKLKPRIRAMDIKLRQLTANRELVANSNVATLDNTLETAITLPDFKAFASNVGKWFSRRRNKDAA
jgi:hypothetical protein